MKAVRIHEDGGPEVLRYEDVPDPEPGPGEVLVRLRAASLNHLDVWVRRGLPSVPKPRILGADGAGVVEALGEGVDGFAPGDRVVINPGLEHGTDDHRRRRAHGRHALRADRRYPPSRSSRSTSELSFEEAAAFPLVYETAYRMLVTRGRLQRGRVGADLGHRRRSRDCGVRDLRARSVRAPIVTSGSRREARARPRMGRRRRRQPRRR